MMHIIRGFCLLLVCVTLVGTGSPAQAQRRTPTPTITVLPTETPTPTLTPIPRLSGAAVTLQQLRQKDVVLKGPLDAVSFNLALPPEWQLTGSGALFLGISTTYPKGSEPNSATRPPAVLHIGINGVGLPDVVLDQADYRQVIFSLPDAVFAGKQPYERQVISVQLDDRAQCAADQQVSVSISARSQLDLPHAENAAAPDLRHLPWPLYQESLLTDTATVALPDQPTPAEINAALTVMAGLARMTNGKLAVTLTPIGRMPPAQWAESHMILVGKPNAFGMLRDVVLPNVTSSDGLGFVGTAPTDGVIQLARSPWGRGRNVLLISGQTDEAIGKAARAFSAGQVRPANVPNLAIVAEVKPAARLALPETFSLHDLGYDLEQFESNGKRTAMFVFDIPDDKAAKDGAYMDLSYVHSPLLDYAQSGLVLALNGQNVGAVRFDDNSTQTTVARVSLPKTALRPGRNELTMNADLRTLQKCIVGTDLWTTVRPESMLHVPLTAAVVERLPRRLALNTFPRLFINQPTLSEMAFVLPPNDADSWAVAGRLAYELGRRTSADVIDLATVFANDVPPAFRERRHLIVVGQPTQLAVLDELRAVMPAPFATGTNIAAEPKAAVQYQLPTSGDIGYLEYVVGPWSDQRAVLMILGNTPLGLQAAAETVLNLERRAKLTGNLAVINGDQVDSSSIAVQAGALTTADAVGDPTATPVVNVVSSVNTPTWLVPAVIVTFGALLVILLISLIILRLRRRTERIEIEE